MSHEDVIFHLPVGLVNDDKSEKPEEVADSQDPLGFWTETNNAGVGQKGILVNVVAVQKFSHVFDTPHRVVLHKVPKIDDGLNKNVSVQ